MTATDVLRRMLDERGVKYKAWDGGTHPITVWYVDGQAFEFVEYRLINGAKQVSNNPWDNDGHCMLTITNRHCTPEQAIAATLGSCNCPNNCTNGERTETCEMEYVSDWMSWHCKSCDHMDMAPRNPKPRYCKWCGRKVVDPTTNDVDAEVEQ